MSRRGRVRTLRAGTALGLLVIVTAQANAGSFAIREQSVYGQGASFAGIAAGGALSSMFWNPATMTQVPGIQSESTVSAIFPYATHTPLAGSDLAVLGGAPNSGEAGLVPGSYFSMQLRPDIWLGMSVNAPFALSVSLPGVWAGRDYGANDSNIKSYNATPSLAWRINDWVSVGVGVQIQYAKATLSKGITLPGPTFSNLTLDGSGWGYGFTAGATFTPTPTTTIGIGYRSFMNQKIEGTLVLAPPLGAFSTLAEATVDLPDVVSLGIRQRMNPQLTLLGTVEWTNWSRLGTTDVLRASGGPATVLGNPVRLPFQYDDGWLFSVGAEYQWSDRLTLRSGIGYELSPVSDRVRIPVIPDNDKFWLSIGASWAVWKGFSFDVAYSHLWVKDPSINITATSGNPWFDGVAYVGDVNAHVDILSIALRYRWDTPAAVKAPLITK
jgi:long-chain fatty acid transport protein